MWRINMLSLSAGTLLLVVISSLNNRAGSVMSAAQYPLESAAVLRDTTNQVVGTVKFKESGSGVTWGGNYSIRVRTDVEVHDLQPGFHGFHIVTWYTNDTSCAALLMARAPTRTPVVQDEGKLPYANYLGGVYPDIAGVLPVLLVDGDGRGQATFQTFRLEGIGGEVHHTAAVIYDKPDNYTNIPTGRYGVQLDKTTLQTGDVGNPIACGVLVGLEEFDKELSSLK